MRSQDPDIHYQHIANKPVCKRTREELYRTVEFDGADMYEKALAKAKLARLDFSNQMIVTAAGSFFGVFFGVIAGLLAGWFS